MINFLEKRGLKDIKNISRVIDDIIEDRVAIIKDGVKTFEKFTNGYSDKKITLRECFYKGVGRSSISHEKILADFYDVSLSQVDVIDSDKHLFNVEGKKICVYTEDDLNSILSNLKEFFINDIVEKSVEIGKVSLKIKIGNIIDNDKLNSNLDEIVNLNKVKEVISMELQAESVSDKYYIGEISKL